MLTHPHDPLSVGFLLGAGVSIPAAPSTAELTDVVLGGIDQYFLHSDEEWYRRPAASVTISQENLTRQDHVAKLIHAFSELVERYYGERRNPVGCPVRWCNYEDIAYLADSLANSLTRNRDDPGLQALADSLQRQFDWSVESLLQAAEDTVALVRAVVFIHLVDLHPGADHMRIVLDAARDPDVPQFPIYTLNHDCLLEDSFEVAGVRLFDFRQADTSGRLLLNLDAPIPNDARATLYKPHGSVRWRRFRPIHAADGVDPWFTEWIGWDRDFAGNRHDGGNVWRSIGGPLILVGRFNKELDYLDGPFWPTFVALAHSLATRDQIVISGYGFGDKAINTMFINWVCAKPERQRRLIVMHNNEETLLASARGSIRDKWGAWLAHGILHLIRHFPSDYSWPELKGVLLKNP